jgi:RNA polymerase sigma-70 factor (ECF subfamily)
VTNDCAKTPASLEEIHWLKSAAEACTLRTMEESLDGWFKREILAHDATLTRYLLRVWRKRDEVHDLRQETYARVYEAALVSRPRSARAFLFTTAHHLMTDRIRRERVVSIEAVADIDSLNLSVDEISAEQRVSARQELKLLAWALDRLPPRCRRVMWLRRVEGLSQRQVAEQLGVSVKAVEQQVSKGSRLLAEYVLGREAARGEVIHAGPELEDGSGQGTP